jgi:hypothetical protein
MASYETYSKRLKRLQSAGKQDVYEYEKLPHPFRVQVIHIWNSPIGLYFVPSGYAFNAAAFLSPANQFWSSIHKTMIRELGVFALSGDDNPAEQCRSFLLAADTGGALDIIELSFRVIDRFVRKMEQWEKERAKISQKADDAIQELNERFKEHGIGYEYDDGILIRLDSRFVHAEIVKPALGLLNANGFDGPADEFIRAFEHYRHGRNKEAIAEALKAFESTMKAICAARHWSHPSNATAIPLINILLQKGLIPADLESHFSALRAAMESGLPTLSNKTSRHGQGATPVEIPPHFAGYALHLMASNIVFLVEAHKALP